MRRTREENTSGPAATLAMTTLETTKERWWEAEVHRIAGEIARNSPEPDAAKAEPISSVRSRLNASSMPSPGNCAPR
jgi:hypothetical protein